MVDVGIGPPANPIMFLGSLRAGDSHGEFVVVIVPV